LYNDDSYISAQNCVFYGNEADKGAGVANIDDSYGWFINCTFAENVAGTYGSSMYNDIDSDGWVRVINTIMYNDTSPSSKLHLYNDNDSITTVAYSDIQDCDGSANWDTDFGVDAGGNVDCDPVFEDTSDIDGDDDELGTSDDGLIPTMYWFVDSADGYNASAYDIVGTLRKDIDVKPDTGIGNCCYADMGAYEVIDLMITETANVVIMCFIDESSYYSGSSSRFETDLEDYDDILLDYTGLTVTTGCYVPPQNSNPECSIYDVLPSLNYTIPSNIFMDTFWEFDNRLQMEKNWFIDIFDDLVGTTLPVAIFLLVDNSSSLAVADLEYHYDDDEPENGLERDDPYDNTKGYSGFKAYLKSIYGDNKVICNDGYEGITYGTDEKWLKWINDLLLNNND